MTPVLACRSSGSWSPWGREVDSVLQPAALPGVTQIRNCSVLRALHILKPSIMKQCVSLIPTKDSRTSGFTLLELLLVLVIVAMTAALVAPAIGTRFTSADPRQAIAQLRAAMELMRVQAIEEGKEEILVVAPEDGRYWHEGGDGGGIIPPESGELVAQGRFTRETGEVEFHFYPDGTNSGGEVRIEKPRNESGKMYSLLLNPLLGTATIRREN